MADRYEDDTPLTELVELMATRVDGVQSPANGAPGFLVIKAAAPAAKAQESQESDHMVEAVTGSPVPGATCNADTADGSMCRRQPAAGSARCHLHQNVPLTMKAKGSDDVNTGAQLQWIGERFPELPVGSVVKERAGSLLTLHRLRALAVTGGTMPLSKAMSSRALGFSPEQADEIALCAAAIKGAVQDALNGTATPEAGGSFASGGSGLSGPATGGVNPAIRANMTDNGLPGVVGSLQGGESAYTAAAEGRLNGGDGAPEGAGLGLAALVRAMSGRSQSLPAPAPGSNTLPGSVPGVVKESLADVAAKQRAVKRAEEGGDPRQLQHADEALALALLRAESVGRFGGGPRGGQR